MHTETLIHAGLAIGCIWSLACRIHQMPQGTRHCVFLQHALLALGIFVSLFVRPEYQMLSVLAGLTCYLGFSAHRWKSGPPPGILNK